MRWIAIFLFTLVGCSRHDTEALGRVGRKLLDRSHAATLGAREKLNVGLQEIRGLKETVHDRLTHDKHLHDLKIEVEVVRADVELKGVVKTDEQRRRAVEIAESTLGVERVKSSLLVGGS